MFEEIKDFDYANRFGTYMRNLKMGREIVSYQYIIYKYEEEHTDVFEVSEKTEPPFPEFAAQINKDTNFFILDHGYVKIR